MNRLLLAFVSVLLVVSLVAPAAATTATPAANSNMTGCEFPFSNVDATGTDVTVTESAKRIVTLGGSAAQTVWEIDGADQVVGVTEYASYLDGAGEKTTVGGFNINIETVVSLNPDIVLAPNTVPDDTVSKLRDAGLTVYKFREATSIEFIAEKTLLTGKLIGNCQAAEERTATFRSQVETISEAVAGEPRPEAVHILGKRGWAAGSETFINKIIQQSGGTNIAADKFSGYQQISAETVIAENPQWITRPREFDLAEYNETTAVKENQVLTLNENYISQPAPRITIPMVRLVKAWHPEAYEDANLETITDTSESKIGPTTYSHTILDNESVRLDVSLNYFENETAQFTVPAAFTNGSNPRLTGIQVTPHEPNWNFGVTVTKLTNNTTLPGSTEPLAGYHITPHGMWPDALETMSISAELNTSQLATPVSADDLTAYTNQSGNWSEVDVHTNTTNATITMHAETSTYTSMYFARHPNASAGQTTIELTVTEANTTANTTTATQPSTSTTAQSTTSALPATESNAATSAQQPTRETSGTTIPGFGPLTTILSLTVVGAILYGYRRPS